MTRLSLGKRSKLTISSPGFFGFLTFQPLIGGFTQRDLLVRPNLLPDRPHLLMPQQKLKASVISPEELDDGWPESVEEQGLLLLVWRHHITKQYIKDVL